MSWMQLSLNTTEEAVDWVCSLLASTNYTSDIRIAKYTESKLHELIDQDITQPCWAFTVCFYLPCDVHTNVRRSEIVDLLSPLERVGLATTIHTNVFEDKPANSEEISPVIRHIGKRFVVLSADTSDHSQAVDEVTLRLKTSLAFGSGLHPATILSLQLIERHVVPEMNVLDLGSGSGILSVAMAKLGAQVLALDNDPIAVESTHDAVHRNQVEQQVTVMEGSLGQGSSLGHWLGRDTISNVATIEPTASFDLIIANILARIHIALAPDFRRSLRHTDKQAGILITSGFSIDYEDAVTTSLKDEGFEVIDCERLDEWVALAYSLK
ncbi:50S ribosomal protein L11 methyltransferase [Pelatocladus sp. BLCC-F211]|uniref:50S ribosomal protein L11 methyltransferase n=1 Tax=Pelatocladus sp. BLCC-F211 TaxID=3342752 RepID=UPI0035B6E697